MIIIVVSVCPFRSILDQSLILPAHWTVSRVETRRLLVVVVKALAMADMCTDAEGVCSSECMSACWTSALTGGAPPCLHDCADSNACDPRADSVAECKMKTRLTFTNVY